jgi:hypothetical protein
MAGLGIVAAAFAILGAAAPAPKVITAERFVLVDASGHERAELSSNSKNAAFQLLNADQSRAVVLSSGSAGNAVLLFDKVGNGRQSLMADQEEATYNIFRDGYPRDTFAITDNLQGTVLAVRDSKGHELVDLGTAKGGGLSITDANDIPRVMIGNQGLMAFNEYGKVYWTSLGENMSPDERKHVMDIINSTTQPR